MRTFRAIASQTISWEWLLTIWIVCGAVFLLVTASSLERSAQIGEFISGFSAALAFLWLIVGLRSQAADLKMQRQELALQRVALEKQAKELKNSSKFASLSQIEAVLDRAATKIRESPTGAKDPQDITSVWITGMAKWKMILESRDAALVSSLYEDWIKVEVLAKSYLASISVALKIFMEHHLERSFDSTLSDEEFVYIYSSWMNKAPYLSEHLGPAYMIANLVFLSQPGLKALRVGGMYAIGKATGVLVFKEGALEKMREELVRDNISIPEIAKQ
jgi:hypothetical protein